ncbi:MAG: cytochrome b N-terminal domain-containing protein, partial [Planctomycetota bacterium]
MTALIRGLTDWLDDRAGVRKLTHEALFELVPGGSRWRYVWGSTLVMAFFTQVVTGVFLWMVYSPSTQTAWESVYYIQHETSGGWLLRGVHHFMAQAMIVLMALHFLQVVWDGAYRAPRELNFVLGMVLMLIVLGLSFTGYLLPWDQKGYWATSVGTSLASQAPAIGPEVRKLAIGGNDYGHQTLTRFFALHAGVLPGLLVVFLVIHLALFRRHGLHAADRERRPDETFWPGQVLKDSVAALGVLVVVLCLTFHFHGAELTAPADPANPYDAARPEWYFLFLFEFLKYFPGEAEVWGAFVIPGAVVLVMFLMPWIGRSRIGHAFNILFLVILLGGAALLTARALRDDYCASWMDEEEVAASDDPQLVQRYETSQRFLAAKAQAHHEAQRVVELAQSPARIPPLGALAMAYRDPFLQGPKLFRQNCASCHDYVDPDDQAAPDNIVNANPSAPNLYGLGTPAWNEGWLDYDRIVSPHYYGYEDSPFLDGEMVSFVEGELSEDFVD